MGHKDIAKLLLENEADVNAKNDDENTALIIAANHNKSRTCEIVD